MRKENAQDRDSTSKNPKAQGWLTESRREAVEVRDLGLLGSGKK